MRGGVRRAEVVVGRSADLERLRHAIATISAGEPDCVLLTGEGGIGKTRLLTDLIGLATRRRVPVLVGRASIGSPVAFGVIAEAVRSWIRTHPSAGRAPSIYDRGIQLIIPEWTADAAAAGLTDAQVRLLALEGLVNLIAEISRSHGALLVIDDLHTADPESLEALRYLISSRTAGVGIVAAARLHESTTVDQLIDNLDRQGLAEVRPIDPLEPSDVADLVATLLGSLAPHAFVEEVAARADGLPLYVEELVDAHLRAGSITIDGSGARWRGGADVVPRSATALVATRLGSFSPPERDVLIAAAVVGGDDLGLLATVSGQPEATARAALRTAVDAGLMESIGGRVAFRHAIVADAVRAQGMADDLRQMNRRAAGAIHEIAADDATLERVSVHLGAADDREGAATVLVEAAQLAMRGHALLRAEALAERARALADTDATSVAADDALAEALAALGRWTEALTVDEATVARVGYTSERWMRMARCALDDRNLDKAAALATVTEAWPDARSPFLDVTHGWLALAGGDTTRALEHAAAAIAATDDHSCWCAALDLQGRAHEIQGNHDQAARAWEQQQRVAAAAGLTAERIRGLVALAELELFTGRRPERMVDAVEVARAAGALVEQVQAQLNLAVALCIQGDPRAATRIADDAAATCRQHRLDLLPYVRMPLLGAAHLLGAPDFDAMLADVRAHAGQNADAIVHTSGIAGDHYLHLGAYDKAIIELKRVTDTVLANPGRLPTDSAYWYVLALLAAGRNDEARDVLAATKSQPAAVRWYTCDFVAAVLDAILANEGDKVDAALSTATDRMPYESALARVLAAEILGGPHQARWLREALDLYEAHDGLVAIDRVRGLLRQAGATLPRRRRRTGSVPASLIPLGVTAREAEVLELVVDGLSNRAIADKLYLSVRTVESHVSSLLAKLGAETRSGLADVTSALLAAHRTSP